jgi:hypothetical protein
MKQCRAVQRDKMEKYGPKFLFLASIYRYYSHDHRARNTKFLHCGHDGDVIGRPIMLKCIIFIEVVISPDSVDRRQLN